MIRDVSGDDESVVPRASVTPKEPPANAPIFSCKLAVRSAVAAGQPVVTCRNVPNETY